MNAKKWITGLSIGCRALQQSSFSSARQYRRAAAERSQRQLPRFEIPDFSAVTTFTPRLIQIAIGNHHSCALTPAGGVVCWGTNSSGELGDGTTNQSPFPVAVHGLNSGVISLALADFAQLRPDHLWPGLLLGTFRHGYQLYHHARRDRGSGPSGNPAGSRASTYLRADCFR